MSIFVRVWLWLFLVLYSWNNHSMADVAAKDYQQFWLWAGVHPPVSILQHSQILYILQGEIGGNSHQPELHIQGVSPVLFSNQQLWLVWRVQRLDWSPVIVNTIINRTRLWQQKGNQIKGIQIDFDARTLQLNQYSDFLRQLRLQLPSNWQISITGLLDWTKTGDINSINQLNGVIDELVVQTYQGRQTVNNYGNYLTSLKRLTIPFKIGLVQGGDWDATWQKRLQQQPLYQGEVVFLLNNDKR